MNQQFEDQKNSAHCSLYTGVGMSSYATFQFLSPILAICLSDCCEDNWPFPKLKRFCFEAVTVQASWLSTDPSLCLLHIPYTLLGKKILFLHRRFRVFLPLVASCSFALSHRCLGGMKHPRVPWGTAEEGGERKHSLEKAWPSKAGKVQTN